MQDCCGAEVEGRVIAVLGSDCSCGHSAPSHTASASGEETLFYLPRVFFFCLAFCCTDLLGWGGAFKLDIQMCT